MTSNAELTARSLASVWHPCTQMKHHQQYPLVPIASASGVWLTDVDGRRILDAVSCWWVNLFGHANARINAALIDQLGVLEHAMLAGFTHEPVVRLSEKLAQLSGLGHAFYASDGASAVEIALKMSFHYWRNCGQPDKQKFVSLEGSYHGETIGALSVTDVAMFRDAYGPLLNNNIKVANPSTGAVFEAEMAQTPQPTDTLAFRSEAGVQPALAALQATLAAQHQMIAALIVEPLVQGAAGMRMYHPQYLRAARALCDRYGVHLIVDEVMTGFGRTGSMFAHQQAEIRPDFMCLSKGITGGYLPLSCVLTTDAVYAAFYHDDLSRGFLHSHSYSGSALACRAALATLEIFESDDVIAVNSRKTLRFNALMTPIIGHPRVRNARNLGMIWAFEVESSRPDFARDFFARAIERGVLLRPIGRSVYFMPPYVISDDEFSMLVRVAVEVIDAIGE